MKRMNVLTLCGALGLIALYTLGIAGYPLQDPDEGRYAAIPLEMLLSGDWVTPRLNGASYFEKPPLLYWLVASCFSILGVSEGVARLVPACAAILTVAIVWLLGRREVSARAGALGAAILATSPLFFVIGQTLVIDGLLTLLWTATLAATWLAATAPDEKRRAWVLVATAACALGVLAKGLVALAVPGLTALLWLALERDWRTARLFLRPSPIAVFLVLTVPWFVRVAQANPDFLEFFFIREHFGRYMAGVGHREGPWYYLPVLAAGPLPWTALAAGLALSPAGRAAFRSVRGEPLVRFLGLWSLTVIGFFGLASSKLAPYVLPAFPPAALLAGIWLDRVLRFGDGLRGPLGSIGGGMVVLGLLASGTGGLGLLFAEWNVLGALFDAADVWAVSRATLACGSAATVGGWLVRRLARTATDGGAAALRGLVVTMGLVLLAVTVGRSVGKTSRAMGLAIRAQASPDAAVVAYERFMQSLGFYAGRRVVLIDNFGELRPSEAWTPDRDDWFWHGRERLLALWASPTPVFLATGNDELAGLTEILDPPPVVLVREHRRVLVTKPAPPGPAAATTRRDEAQRLAGPQDSR